MTILTNIEPTPTRAIRETSARESTRHEREVDRVWPQSDHVIGPGWTLNIPASRYPAEETLLKVVMTFEGGNVRMEAVDIGVSAEGRTAQDAQGRLVEKVSAHLKDSGDERIELLHYPPENWFKIVPPGQTTSADNATLADGVISVLNQLYEFKGDMVKAFLKKNRSLSGLLFEAHGIIRKHFGPDVEMALEVVTDPEALGDQQLFVLIRTKLPPKEARAYLAELDRGWWLNALPATEGKMEIALE